MTIKFGMHMKATKSNFKEENYHEELEKKSH
jgi:hypothetical protein